MFQNDNVNYEASSSQQQQQQTNSALSVHVVRLSRGRVHALFWAFIIFSTWFQLVAQVQTAISLFLIAVIGFLLGRATNAETAPATSYATSYEDGPTKQPLDPLVKRAHSALNLLKSFSDDDDDDNHSSIGCRQRKLAQKERNEKSPTSPSASSTNSSSVSTGYNSDTTRSTNLMVVSRGISTNPDFAELTGCDSKLDQSGMIELVSEPTAMRIAMDELTGYPQRPVPLASLSVQTSRAPLKPPRHQYVDGEAENDDEEPHYSSPTSTTCSASLVSESRACDR